MLTGENKSKIDKIWDAFWSGRTWRSWNACCSPPKRRENRQRFEQVFGHQQSLGMFIRKLVGLDREAASEALGEFLHNTTYPATQIRFIDQVVNYLTQNGSKDPGLLYEPPFTDIHNEGLDGVFGNDGATKIIHLLEGIELGAAA